jgi:ferritin
MSCIPSIESILLEIHQSFGLGSFTTKQKSSFAQLKRPLEKHRAQFRDIFDEITQLLEITDSSQYMNIISDIGHFISFQKDLEQSVWTFNANSKQILWQLLSHSYAPGIARNLAIWDIEESVETGMPGGKFWYLPTENIAENKLDMPVTQVCDWLLDLLDIPLDRIREFDFGEQDSEALIRNIYNWKAGKVPRTNTLCKSFSDDRFLVFNGCFLPDKKLNTDQQFEKAIEFVNKRGLTAELLSFEIPINDVEALEAILSGNAEAEVKNYFVILLQQRYAKPTLKTIRKRFLVARCVQDAYIRLLKYLCPGVEATNPDMKQNKLLQVIHSYKYIYNLTIEAHRKTDHISEEDTYFDKGLNDIDKHGLFISVAPSYRPNSFSHLGELLTKRFKKDSGNDVLPDLFDIDPKENADVLNKKILEITGEGERTNRLAAFYQDTSSKKLKELLKQENEFWTLSHLAQDQKLKLNVRTAAQKRLNETTKDSTEQMGSILSELVSVVDLNTEHKSTDALGIVNNLLHDIDTRPGYECWQGPIESARAKHYLAQNDFPRALEHFKLALDACSERNYGPMRGLVARDTLATLIQVETFSINNHEKYYREMIANGGVENTHFETTFLPSLILKSDDLDKQNLSLTPLLKELNEYFWRTLYQPYNDIDKMKQPHCSQESSRSVIDSHAQVEIKGTL